LPPPASNSGFREAASYQFDLPSGWSVRVDDELLAGPAGGSPAGVWSPRFFAGEVTAEVRDSAGRLAGLFLLDVSPDPLKLGRDVFEQMIGELWAADPSLVLGDEPGTIQTGELGAFEDPWIAFARLRRHAGAFLAAVNRIAEQPRLRLVVARDSAPLHRVRRADRRTAMSVLRSPAVALFAGEAASSSWTGVCAVDVPVVETTVDSAANRAILSLMHAMRRRARALLGALQKVVERETDSDTRTALEARWPPRRDFLVGVVETLTRATRRAPWCDVYQAEITAAGLTAVASDPDYSRGWSRGWRALRQGVESGELTDRLWTSPTWEIYERWCFLNVGRLLRASLPERQWVLESRPRRRWLGVGAKDRIELLLQPTFQAGPAHAAGRWSVSRQRVPDLLLSVVGDGAPRFVVLDAKYRASRQNVLEAMESAHLYQDSLRIRAERPRASLLIVPAAGGAPWLEDSDFQAEHRVGVWPHAPGQANALPSLVAQLVQ
jgi:hypothetical protein